MELKIRVFDEAENSGMIASKQALLKFLPTAGKWSCEGKAAQEPQVDQTEISHLVTRHISTVWLVPSVCAQEYHPRRGHSLHTSHEFKSGDRVITF